MPIEVKVKLLDQIPMDSLDYQSPVFSILSVKYALMPVSLLGLFKLKLDIFLPNWTLLTSGGSAAFLAAASAASCSSLNSL